MPTIVATAGAANANSFCELSEIDAYFDSRAPLETPWVPSGALNAQYAVMATRVLCAMMVERKTLKRDGMGGKEKRPYYLISRKWVGTPTTVTQSLPFPMTGIVDRLGRAVDPLTVPQEIKDAQSELAGLLQVSDTTIDNDVITQGITSVKAGSVAVSFKEYIDAHVIPDSVLNLIPPSWLTDERIEYASKIVFKAV